MPVVIGNTLVEDSKTARMCAWRECPRAGEYDGIKMKACGRCNNVRYCCKSCQQKDWSSGGHKSRCRAPETLDIQAWMKKHETVFKWAALQALQAHSGPGKSLKDTHCLVINIVREDQLPNKPSTPFVVVEDSFRAMTFAEVEKIITKDMMSSFLKAKADTETEFGNTKVVFLSFFRGTMVVLVKTYGIIESPEALQGQSVAGWRRIAAGLVNGNIGVGDLTKTDDANKRSSYGMGKQMDELIQKMGAMS